MKKKKIHVPTAYTSKMKTPARLALAVHGTIHGWNDDSHKHHRTIRNVLSPVRLPLAFI